MGGIWSPLCARHWTVYWVTIAQINRPRWEKHQLYLYQSSPLRYWRSKKCISGPGARMSGCTFRNSSSALVPPFLTPMMMASGSLRVLPSSDFKWRMSDGAVTLLPDQSPDRWWLFGVCVTSESFCSYVSPIRKLFDAVAGIPPATTDRRTSAETTNWPVSSAHWPTAITSLTYVIRDRLVSGIVCRILVIHSLHWHQRTLLPHAQTDVISPRFCV